MQRLNNIIIKDIQIKQWDATTHPLEWLKSLKLSLAKETGVLMLPCSAGKMWNGTTTLANSLAIS